MTNEVYTHVEIEAIEKRARALRAEATREFFVSVAKFVRRQFHFGAAQKMA